MAIKCLPKVIHPEKIYRFYFKWNSELCQFELNLVSTEKHGLFTQSQHQLPMFTYIVWINEQNTLSPLALKRQERKKLSDWDCTRGTQIVYIVQYSYHKTKQILVVEWINGNCSCKMHIWVVFGWVQRCRFVTLNCYCWTIPCYGLSFQCNAKCTTH